MIVKVCKVHGNLQSNETYIRKDKKSVNGYYTLCRKCKISWEASYRDKNREKYNIIAKECYYRNRDKNKINNKERMKIYRLKNKERISMYNKKYREKNMDKISLYFKSYIRKRSYSEKIKDRIYAHKNVMSMSDSYIRGTFYKNVKSVSSIPDCLIEAKREILKIKRYIKENRNANT